ncbi:MAG: hypothetical protein GXO74_16310 [Calditrichaeota bacterium]|nr:hypothetical protein [Calditrichota bacterium]
MKWLTWPFVVLWRLLTAILELIGRILTGIFGIMFLVFGAILAATVVAAPVNCLFDHRNLAGDPQYFLIDTETPSHRKKSLRLRGSV